MDHNTIIEEYTDYLVSNIAYNMVVALTTIEDLEVYQRLAIIDMKESLFKYEIEVIGSVGSIDIPFGKVPLICDSLEQAEKLEKKFRNTIEQLIEENSGIKTLEKYELEQLEKKCKKSNLKIIK